MIDIVYLPLFLSIFKQHVIKTAVWCYFSLSFVSYFAVITGDT